MEAKTFNKESQVYRDYLPMLEELMNNTIITGDVKECIIKSRNAVSAAVDAANAAYADPDEEGVIANKETVDTTPQQVEVLLPHKRELMALRLSGNDLNKIVGWFCADWSE
jgi:hypothetical protein